MKNTIIPILLLVSINQLAAQTQSKQASSFEGVVYSATSFPGHSVNKIIKQIDFDKERVDKQYKSLRESISKEPDVVNDQMYLMALALMPVQSKTYFTPSKSLTHMQALGYEWQVLLDEKEGTSRMFLQSNDGNEKGTINFDKSELKKLWEKEEVGTYEGEYSMKTSAETAVIAGYPTKKITYMFSGTSQGPVATSKIVSTIPWKITVWYTDVVDPRINIQNPFYFKLDKAVLKTEVEFDKEGKKKVLYEVTKIEPKKIDEDEMKIAEIGEVVDHKPTSYESLSLIMKLMAEAGKISWQ